MAASTMRLLVLDQSWQIRGGVETIRRFFLPAVAKQAEKTVWACSTEHSRNPLRDVDFSGIEIVDLFDDKSSWRGMAWAGIRRLPRGNGQWRSPAQTWLSHSHLRNVCTLHRITHVLEISAYQQSFPRLGLPTAGFVHDLSQPGGASASADAKICEWLKYAVKIFAISTQTRKELLGIDASATGRIDVVPLASSPVQAPPSNAANPFARQEPVLFYPGVVTWHKGHDILFAALEKLAGENLKFHLYLTGNGTQCLFDETPTQPGPAEDMRKICAKFGPALKDRVTLLGVQPWTAVEQLYQAASVVVLPTRYEGFGLPLSESLRRDKPVVASRIGPLEDQVAFYGAQDVVRWVEPGNMNALADALRQYLSGESKFPKFSDATRSRVAAWNWDAVANKIISGIAASAPTA